MSEGECPIRVGILLVLDVAPEVVAWDNHERREQDVDGIVDCAPWAMICVYLVLK